MSRGTPFSIGNFSWWRSPGMEEFRALMESLPQAALLAELQSQHILIANSKASELTAFTRAELSDLDLPALFTTWSASLLDARAEASQQIKELTKRNGTQVEVWTTTIPLHPRGKWVLVFLESVQLRQQQHAQVLRLSHFWDKLYDLVSIPYQTDFESGLDAALEAGISLTEAGILAIYKADDQNPVLQLYTGRGAVEHLPEQLPAQDLVHLRTPHLWSMGKRTSSSLHRAARATRLAYLASAPLGQLNASIGLVVMADTKGSPPEQILPLIQILSASITSIVQQHVISIKALDNLKQLNRVTTMNATIEEAVQEGLLVLSPDLKTLTLNQAAELILGYASREVAGQPVEKILIGTENLATALAAARMGSPTYSLGNVRLYRRSGEAFLAQIRIFPVVDDGQVDRIIIVVHDLSEQEQVREHTQQLEQRAILGEVTAIFAHEVRNPINNISTGLQLMAMNLAEDDPNRESIARLQQDCDRLAELMKSVLAYSRPTDYEMENFDLGQLLQRLLERLHLRMARVNVQYHLQIEPNCPPTEGNSRALEQVFTNLINNATQAMSDDGGRLAIKIQSVKTPEGRGILEVSIADTGAGIPKELQDRIFQPFFTTKGNGTGLGLAIAKRIITAHKGNIRVTSFPGGTVFHIQLPVASP